MKTNYHPIKKPTGRRARPPGMTIIELTATLAVMMALASIIVYSASGIGDWKLAREAALELRSVYVAQKSYLADHPTLSITSVTEAKLLPYMPNTPAAIPTLEALDGGTLAIDYNVMPPVAKSGGGVYDPSGSSTDGLWDVGPR